MRDGATAGTTNWAKAARGGVREEALARYREIEDEFVTGVAASGVRFESKTDGTAAREACVRLKDRLARKGARVCNGGASVSTGFVSPSCVACTGSSGSLTFSLSLACHRRCFFCFNPNQADWSAAANPSRSVDEAVERIRYEAEHGRPLAHIGLTGGEPLLHPGQTARFFREVRRECPGARTRLYTSGDQLDEGTAQSLADAGLDEIRFSVKLDDDRAHERVLDAMATARRHVPTLMVEMPVIPGTGGVMRDLLRELDRMGVDGVNLLELCYPMHGWDAFEARGLRAKNPPFDVLYEYEYAGGIAIAQSELESLRLIEFALDEGLGLGIHVCTLDNKHRSEVRRRNEPFSSRLPLHRMSPRTFFLETLKVFDDERERATRLLDGMGEPYENRPGCAFLQCLPGAEGALFEAGLHPCLSSSIVEERDGRPMLRELALVEVGAQRPADVPAAIGAAHGRNRP